MESYLPRDKTGELATLLPKFFLPCRLDGKLIDRPMTRRDLARVLVGDTSQDLMDLTAILSYERDTNYVIKDKMSDIYTRARMYAPHHSDLSCGISMLRKIGNFYILASTF